MATHSEYQHDGATPGRTTGHQTSSEPARKIITGHQPAKLDAKDVHPPVTGFKGWIARHKLIIGGAALLVIVAVLAIVPATRFALAGLVTSTTYKVKVVDAETNLAVSSAVVEIDGKKVSTNGKGEAKLELKPGPAELRTSKNYYKTASQQVTVPIGEQQQVEQVRLRATGRQLPVVLVNAITGQPVANGTIKAAGTEAKTDKEGKAVIVLPADKQEGFAATVQAEGYNPSTASLTVKTANVQPQTLTIVPSGRVYFLSNQSGKIDVVGTNLDGSDRKTVLEGTGKEDQYGMGLWATKDWKYIALKAQREATPKLYLIETATGKLTVMDEGDATFEPVGWSDHHFVYTVERLKIGYDQPNRFALKTYDASRAKITTIVQSQGQNLRTVEMSQRFTSINIWDGKLTYVTNWISNNAYNYAFEQDKQNTFSSVNVDGSDRRIIKSYSPTIPGGTVKLTVVDREPGRRYVINQLNFGMSGSVELYDNGTLTAVGTSISELFSVPAKSYVASPSGRTSYWHEPIDGANILFKGDKVGQGAVRLPAADKQLAYAWYTDEYMIVLNQRESGMYIRAADGSGKSLKIADFLQVAQY
jgi:hypothetical protein